MAAVIWPGPISALLLSCSPAVAAGWCIWFSTAVLVVPMPPSPAPLHQLGWCSLVMPAQWQQHGRAAGPIRNRELLQQAIARAEAHTSPGCLASVLVVAFPGGPGTASLVQQARRMASRSPVPIAVVEVSPSAGLWAVPAGVARS